MVIYDEWLYIKFQLHDVLRFYFISLDHISNQRSIKCAAYMVFKAVAELLPQNEEVQHWIQFVSDFSFNGWTRSFFEVEKCMLDRMLKDLNTLNIFVLCFHPKNRSFQLPYQCPNSSADCARELFNGSNGSASLVDCTPKKFFGWGVWIFCDWHHKWSSFGFILAHVAWP